jgi:Methyltransferase domain
MTSGLLAQILEASRSIHHSGSMSPAALIGLVKHLEARKVRHSVETGAGASTLVFSHLSECHTAFTLDSDESMSRVLRNPLFAGQSTTFVEGPTQKTLPVHAFQWPLQAVLIDGPHAYPFPDLEYFYLYPHIEKNGLLVIDDIHIPTIQSLFRFVAQDDMFRLVEVCGKTAFLHRTGAPTFDPWGDGWWLQRFNKRTLWRYGWQDKLKSAVPESCRPFVRRQADRLRLWLRGRERPSDSRHST